MARQSLRGFARSGGPVQVSLNVDWDETVIDQVVGYMRRNMVPEVMGWMRALVPVDTGKLRDGMWARARKVGKRVAALEAGSTARHFLFVEYGTGTRGRGTYDARRSRSIPLPAGYRHGPSAGMPAQPFARPALINVVATHFRLGGS